MKTDPLKSTLADLAEKAVPSAEINLWPEIQSELSTSAWHSKNGETMNTLAQKTLIRRLALAVLALATAFTLLAFTPQGRAFAQSLLQFFTRAGSDSLPAQSEYPTKPEAPRVLGAGGAEAQAGFDVLRPGFLPEGLVFQGASYTDENRTVIQQFGYAPEDIRLSIQQQPFTSQEACTLCGLVGTSAPVETVQINGVAGEYVEGVWELTENGPVWQNNPYLKTLRWQEDGMAFEMIFMGMELTQTDLLAIAESMK